MTVENGLMEQARRLDINVSAPVREGSAVRHAPLRSALAGRHTAACPNTGTPRRDH